jgi:hypothetical protein
MWTFQKKFFFYQYQTDFNEGQQKVNLIYFHKPSYETLIIGNSRTTYLNHTLVPNSEAFNLGINSLDPSQYNDYIKYAQLHNSQKINQIILTLDFEHFFSDPDKIKTNILHDFAHKTESFLYRYKLLLSFDTLMISFKNIRNVLFDKYKKRDKTYNQSFIVDSFTKTPESIENKTNAYLHYLESASYKKNPRYKDILSSLKSENKDVKFVVFISPLPEPIIKGYLAEQYQFNLYALCVQFQHVVDKK